MLDPFNSVSHKHTPKTCVLQGNSPRGGMGRLHRMNCGVEEFDATIGCTGVKGTTAERPE
jgi:hypothetical protein